MAAGLSHTELQWCRDRNSGLLAPVRAIFPLTLLILLPYLLFLMVRSEIASPDLVSLYSSGSPAPPWSRELQAVSLLTPGKAFLEEKQREAWDSRLRPTASLLVASGGETAPSDLAPPLGGLTHRVHMAACLQGSPGHRLFPCHFLESGFLPDVAATGTHLLLD